MPTMILVLFTSLFISQNAFANSTSAELIVGDVPNQEPDPPVDIMQDRSAVKFPKGIVPYFIETASYDSIIVTRIQSAMDFIEASSCLVFKQIPMKPFQVTNGSWIHFTNPEEFRDCVHSPTYGPNREIIIILGYECMMFRNIVHAILHALGFKDEVSHPHRDQYIRIMWENIQPRYRDLFRVQPENEPYKTVEYDPMSIMHFHDRAFSINGGVTIASRMPGLLINPSDKLSQLDVMKLRLWFGHECNKRKVGALLETCKTVFHRNPSVLAAAANADDEHAENPSVEADDVTDPYGGDYTYGQYDANDGGAVNGDPTMPLHNDIYYADYIGDGLNVDDEYEDIGSVEDYVGGGGHVWYGDFTGYSRSGYYVVDGDGVNGDDKDDSNDGDGDEIEKLADDDKDDDNYGGGDEIEKLADDDKDDGNDRGGDEIEKLANDGNDDDANEIPDDGARRKDKQK